jgi:hypothetical protein
MTAPAATAASTTTNSFPLEIQQIIAEQNLSSVAAITDYFATNLAVKVKHHETHGLLLFMYDQIRTNFAQRGAKRVSRHYSAR